MNSITTHLALFTLAATLLISLGCESTPHSFAAYNHKQTPQPRPTSIALNSHILTKAINKSNTSTAQSNWYNSRNDFTLETYAGQRSAIIDYSFTRVYDRQYSSSTRVHNNYSQYTWQYRSVGSSQ